MQFSWPQEYVAEEDWDKYLIENVPALATLWSKGKYDAYETWKVLNNLTHADYTRNHLWEEQLYAPYIPLMRRAMPQSMTNDIVEVQPMSDYTCEIFEFESKK